MSLSLVVTPTMAAPLIPTPISIAYKLTLKPALQYAKATVGVAGTIRLEGAQSSYNTVNIMDKDIYNFGYQDGYNKRGINYAKISLTNNAIRNILTSTKNNLLQPFLDDWRSWYSISARFEVKDQINKISNALSRYNSYAAYIKGYNDGKNRK